MTRDEVRIRRLQQKLREQSLHALICTLPHNVLLLSGYWPMVGLSVAILTQEGKVAVLAPEDEAQMARNGWADEVRTFAAASLERLHSSAHIVQEALGQAASGLDLKGHPVLGYESEETTVPVPYAALNLFGSSLPELIRGAFPQATLRGAGDLLERMRAVLTPGELERVRLACRIAQEGFRKGAECVQAGRREPEVASAFRQPLSDFGKQASEDARADGWAWCMSGPNSAKAYGAFGRTANRKLAPGDFALVHSNSYAEGFWTDITRTFCLGAPSPRQHAIYQAVLEAFQTAVGAIRPGVQGSVVDRAARDVLKAHGFGSEFKHATGHGVGFAAIDHSARPRLHPVSPDVLETGMVFNVEPAIYIDGYGGVRHCSMIAITEKGVEVLTPFQADIESLIV